MLAQALPLGQELVGLVVWLVLDVFDEAVLKDAFEAIGWIVLVLWLVGLFGAVSGED